MPWYNDPLAWREKPLLDKLEVIRKHYCTGPGGASCTQETIRSLTNAALKEAKAEITELRKRNEFLLSFAKGHSPKMDGTMEYRFHMPGNLNCRAGSPEEALVLSMARAEEYRKEFDEVWPGLRKPE